MADPDRSAEMLRSVALTHLSMGAVHSLNNAFTVILGELGFLSDDRKEDPEVQEACATMREEMDRCTRITRGLLTARHLATNPEPDLDLARTAQDVCRLLPDTLGRRVTVAVDVRDELPLARGVAGHVHSAIAAAAHLLVSRTERSVTLRVAAELASEGPRLTLELTGKECGEAVAAPFADPAAAGDASLRGAILALRDVLDHSDVRLTSDAGDGRASVILLFHAA